MDESLPDKNLLRINKAIADSGFCSRRAAETLILQGRVRVDGAIVRELSLRVNPATQRVEIDGQALVFPTESITLMLHKPVGYVTSRKVQGRKQKSVYDLLPAHLQALDPVGRLDEDSSGLLIFSTDGQLVHHLMHPRFHWPKRYEIGLPHRLDEDDLQRLQEGVWLEPENKLARMEITALSAKVVQTLERQHHERALFYYQAILLTGYKRQIRRSIQAMGTRVFTLHRVAFGPLKLEGLEAGSYRILNPTELKQLE